MIYRKPQNELHEVKVSQPKENFGYKKIDEYLLGSRNMKAVPVAISLIGR